MVNLSGAEKSQISCEYPPSEVYESFGAVAVPRADSRFCQGSWMPDNWQRGDAVWKKWPVADLSRKNLFNHSCDPNLRTETWPGSTCRQQWRIAARGEPWFCQTLPKATNNGFSQDDGFCTVLSICTCFLCSKELQLWFTVWGTELNISKFTFISGIHDA